MKKSWMRVFLACSSINQIQSTPCPECSKVFLSCRYVADPATRIGFLTIWCSQCLKAATMSRVEVPDGVDFTAFGEPSGIPNCTLKWW